MVTNNQLNEGKDSVDGALLSINSITMAVKDVLGSISHIAAGTEEQNAVTENFVDYINGIAEAADKIVGKADKTGKAIFETSILCNQTKLSIIGDGVDFTTAELLDICKTDHLMWRWRVYNMLLGYEQIDIDHIGNHHDCRLGKWYYTMGLTVFSNNKIFKDIEKPHEQLHILAKKAVLAYDKNEIKTAEASLNEMGQVSVQIISLIDKLKSTL